MPADKIIALLDDEDAVGESYVLVRELKLYLDLGRDIFHPSIRVKIWKSSALPRYPYHFTVSHHVHTPTQAGPYYPSRTQASSEEEAVREAISTTTTFLKAALREGHEPEDAWLVLNDDF